MKLGDSTRARLRAILPGLGVVVLLVLPIVAADAYLRYLVTIGMIYGIVASSWDLTLGYGGFLNFGHVAFFGVGAYGAAVLSYQFGVDPWMAMAGGMVLAAVVGSISFLPLIRLRGVYIALITFAFGQLLMNVVLGLGGVTGGATGLVGVPGLEVAGYSLKNDGGIGYYYATLLVLVASTVFLRLLVRSDFGLGLIASRDYEQYASSRGVASGFQRLGAMTASAIFPGAAGALYTGFIGVISPDVFGFAVVALLLSMVFVGGRSTVYGPILAAILLTALSEAIANLGPNLGPLRFMLVSVLIVVVIRYLPDGIWGTLLGDRRGPIPSWRRLLSGRRTRREQVATK